MVTGGKVEAGRRQFSVVTCLGRGGFGEVYRAAMFSSGGIEADVALKVLRRDLDPRGQAVQRLRDEGRMLARLNHPTILRVHDLVVLEGRIALITEFVDGQDLGELLRAEAPPSARALVEVLGHVASALDAAWHAPLGDGSDGKLRLVHRDIKPSNIRISRHGEVKLLDFGIARADSVEREARTQTNLMVGSPAYMAPERYLDNHVDPASDVFALGSILFEGLAGRRLYDDLPVPMIVTLAIAADRYVAFLDKQLTSLQGVPEPLLALLRDTLAYEPGDRIDAAALAARCEALADELPGASLARYCRERSWPDADGKGGELDGRVLTEGTMARIRVERAPSEPPRVRQWGPVVAFLALGTGVLGVFLAVLFGLAGGITLGIGWWPGLWDSAPVAAEPMTSESQEVSASIEPETPSSPESAAGGPGPEPLPREGIDGSPEPEPPVAAPRAGTSSEPARSGPVKPVESPSGEADAPNTPAPASPAPPAGPDRAATGRVVALGDAPAELDVNGERIAIPAEVPPGTWPVYARFHGRDAVRSGDITVRAGEQVSVSCISRMYRCDIQ